MKILFFSLILLSNLSFAGNEGGGGGAIVCRNGERKIETAELLDLFEAPFVHGFNIAYTSLGAKNQVEAAIERLRTSPFEYYWLQDAVAAVMERFKFLPEGVSLNQPADAGENTPVLVKEGCTLDGVGFYQANDGNLLVSKSIFDKFSETDRAAFIIHEAIYKLYRIHHGIGSVISRKMTSMLFATNVSEMQLLDFLKLHVTGPTYLNQKFIQVILPPKTDMDKLELRAENPGKVAYIDATCRDYIFSAKEESKTKRRLGKVEVVFENKGCRDLEYRANSSKLSLYYNDEYVMDLPRSGSPAKGDLYIQFAHEL